MIIVIGGLLLVQNSHVPDLFCVFRMAGDDEFFALEDLCADFAVLQPAVDVVAGQTVLALHFSSALEVAAKVRKLACLSEKMTTDAAFARQVRRKFLQ